jgi:hypothetical protein
MDSNAEPDDLAEICMSNDGWLNCDIDGDGDDDLAANGDRSWLDLNGGGGGASELTSWIENGFPGEVVEHTWYGGQPGAESSTFQTVGDYVGKIYGIPVFNIICDGEPDRKCSSKVHSEDIILTSAGGNYFYHVVAFAGFYVSFVAQATQRNVGRCVENLTLSKRTRKRSRIFRHGILPNLAGGTRSGFDTGVYSKLPR